MEKEYSVITLEDGIDYIIVDEISFENNRFVYLSNINNKADFCIRKIVLKDEKEVLVGLSDDQEFDTAMLLFSKKHEDILKNNQGE